MGVGLLLLVETGSFDLEKEGVSVLVVVLETVGVPLISVKVEVCNGVELKFEVLVGVNVHMIRLKVGVCDGVELKLEVLAGVGLLLLIETGSVNLEK